MTALRYKALDAQGRTVSGVMEADDEKQLRQRLRQQHLRPLRIDVASSGDSQQTSWWQLLFRRQRRLSVTQLSLLTRQLASLINSGLPVDEALRSGAEQARGDRIKGLLAQVRSRVMEGQSLAQAMSEHPGAFDRMYCAMVRAGENAGYLGEVLERLARHTENSQQTRQKLQTALIYPLVLAAVSAGVVVLLMTFVVPRLVGMFASSGRELPALTQLLISVSDFFRSGWALLAVAVRVQEGAAFSKSLQQEKIFPALLVQMAANGEANGSLPTQLEYAASWQQRELDVRLGTVMALLEPLTIVLMGGLITLIMLAVLLPIFDMSSLI